MTGGSWRQSNFLNHLNTVDFFLANVTQTCGVQILHLTILSGKLTHTSEIVSHNTGT